MQGGTRIARYKNRVERDVMWRHAWDRTLRISYAVLYLSSCGFCQRMTIQNEYQTINYIDIKINIKDVRSKIS